MSYAVAIFASAFLLFEVEPIVAKMILPWFGGAAAVWAVCLLFFQAVLLLGYLYAHLLTRKFHLSVQGRIHAALLFASLFVLRIAPRESWKPVGPEHPTLRILLLLAAMIGLPYFLLSTTSPLLQSWYAGKHAGSAPYRFYALSNAGSMLGLLSYPVLIEPRLSNSHQALGWSVGYACVVFLCSAIAVWPRKDDASRSGSLLADRASEDRNAVLERPDTGLLALWAALAACSSALLLAVTNHISQNIASVPFLWILPLSLYLLSFILCFDTRRWYRRAFFLRILGIAIGGMTYALSPSFNGLPWKVLILLFCLGLFACCMFCHGELGLLKPAPEHLTSFYLMVALGGAIGAVFVALVAPAIFSGYYELHAGLGLCAILIVIVHFRDATSPFYRFRASHDGRGMWNPAWLVMAGLAAVVVASLAVTAREQSAQARLAVRNFYGVLRVIDGTEPNVVLMQGSLAQLLDNDPRYRKLMNGTIDHGLQFVAPSRRREPTTYYSANSGVGVALHGAGKARPLRVGAIGLGIGTVATYGREGDRYKFYEINPLVVKVANEEFTFLRDSHAKIEIVVGDARLSLEREGPQDFDVLIVDAFSGDSIPVHLLTREAFELYFRHLKPDGVLAVHISNQYLDLQPVVTAAAQQFGKEAVVVNHEAVNNKGVYPATWILAGNPRGFLAQGEIEKAGHVLPALGPNVHPWTDNYSSLWRVLK